MYMHINPSFRLGHDFLCAWKVQKYKYGLQNCYLKHKLKFSIEDDCRKISCILLHGLSWSQESVGSKEWMVWFQPGDLPYGAYAQDVQLTRHILIAVLDFSSCFCPSAIIVDIK